MASSHYYDLFGESRKNTVVRETVWQCGGSMVVRLLPGLPCGGKKPPERRRNLVEVRASLCSLGQECMAGSRNTEEWSRKADPSRRRMMSLWQRRKWWPWSPARAQVDAAVASWALQPPLCGLCGTCWEVGHSRAWVCSRKSIKGFPSEAEMSGREEKHVSDGKLWSVMLGFRLQNTEK